MRRLSFLLPLTLAALLLAPATAAEQEARVDLVEGATFPAFQGTTWTGEAFDLAPHLNSGKYILVDFWAAWCPPCLEELPNVVRIMNENQNERFEIVTISLDEDATRPRLEKIVADNGLTFPIVTDWKRWKSRYVTEYGVYGIPANFLLAPDGTVLMRDLRGEKMVEITRKFATTPNLNYQPIGLKLEITNAPARPSAENPEIPVVPLEVALTVNNPQQAGGEVTAGVERTAWVRTGEVTLKRNPDGTFVMNKDTGKPQVYQVARTVTEEFTVSVSDSPDGHMRPTIVIPMPEGTLDAALTPFTHSPTLDMEIEGKGAWPSYSAEYWLDEDGLAEQGGIIDVALGAAPEELAESGQIYF